MKLTQPDQRFRLLVTAVAGGLLVLAIMLVIGIVVLG